MDINTHPYTKASISAYSCTHACMCTSICIHTGIHVCMYAANKLPKIGTPNRWTSTHIHTQKQTLLHTPVHMDACVQGHVSMQAFMYACMLQTNSQDWHTKQMDINTHPYTKASIYTYSCTHARMCTSACIHAGIYVCMHAANKLPKAGTPNRWTSTHIHT